MLVNLEPHSVGDYLKSLWLCYSLYFIWQYFTSDLQLYFLFLAFLEINDIIIIIIESFVSKYSTVQV